MRELSPQSTEYQDVLYRLQLCSRSTEAVSNIKVWDITNPHSTVAFERVSRKKLTVDCFVAADGCTTEEEAHNAKGLICPSDGSGMRFVHGEIPATLAKDQSCSGKRTVVLASVAVGRSTIKEVNETANVETLPSGYDSLLVSSSSSVVAEDGQSSECEDEEESDAEYRTEYLVFDPQQVLPKYMATFDYEGFHAHGACCGGGSAGASKRMCDICEGSPAELFCKADDAFLCVKCDAEVHSANKIVAKHVRVPVETLKSRRRMSGLRKELGGTLDVFKSRCPVHASQHVEFFCPTCDIPVCIHCKMVGSHSSGEPGNHTLIGLDTAWKSAVDSSEQPDVALDACAQSIEHHIASIKEKREDVVRNSADVQKQIKSMADEALRKVQDAEKTKLAVLQAAELELTRKMDEIEWSECFLQMQKESLLPVDFLMAWTRHQRLRKSLRDARIEEPCALHEVVADIVADVRIVDVTTTSPHSEAINASEEAGDSEQNIFATLTNRFNTFGRRGSAAAALSALLPSGKTGVAVKEQQHNQQESTRSSEVNEDKSVQEDGIPLKMNDLWRQSLRRNSALENVAVGTAETLIDGDSDSSGMTTKTMRLIEQVKSGNVALPEGAFIEGSDEEDDEEEFSDDGDENDDPIGLMGMPAPRRCSRLSVGGEEAIM
eukprot:g671.t1